MFAAQRLWVRFPGNTHTDKKCITLMHCKSLWIKASAKCINVNVKEPFGVHKEIEATPAGWRNIEAKKSGSMGGPV